MLHIPAHIAITNYALNQALPPQVDAWDNIQGGFLDHLDQVNKDLEKAGLPGLECHK